MDKILKVSIAKNAVKLACLGVCFAMVACDNGDSSSSLQIAWENSCSSAELVASSGDAGLSSGEIVVSSSSVEISSSSGWFKKGDFLNPDIEYGTLVDTRDGKTYSTVVIGNLTWMAENLNYADSVQDPILKGATRCIDERDEDCSVLGRYYDLKVITEVDSSKLLNQGLVHYSWYYQGLCPDGWRIPSNADWKNLVETASNDSSATWYSGAELLSKIIYSEQLIQNIGIDTVLSVGGSNTLGFSAINLYSIYWASNPHLDWEYCCNDGPFWVGDGSYGYDENGQLVNTIFLRHVYTTLEEGVIRCVKGGEGTGEFSTRDDLLNPNVKYDTLVDARDGQIYRTYNGIMAENLNYDDGKALCYNNDERLCALYGRLYGQESLDGDSLDGPCPEGWRLLAGSEHWKFFESDCIVKECDKYMGWGMEDSLRSAIKGPYNIFPAGYYDGGKFENIGWAAAIYYKDYVDGGESINRLFTFEQYMAFPPLEEFSSDTHVSIRCVEKSRYGDIDDDE